MAVHDLGEPCSELQRYVEQRDACLELLSPDRGTSKKIMLAAVFAPPQQGHAREWAALKLTQSGDCLHLNEALEFLSAFGEEMRMLRNAFERQTSRSCATTIQSRHQ